MKKIFFLGAAMCCMSVLFGQQSPVLFTYGNESVLKSEFERVFLKNNNKEKKPDEKSINEYLDLYVNFKLKVKEAKNMGLDTLETFKKELEGYRRQLAQPYLSDKNVSDQLVKEAYDRSLWEINASHILIFCDENALPKDTLVAYNKIVELRKQIMKGEVFDSVASKGSEDPSAKFNKGNLGWFTVFNLIYSFENFAYNTPVGQVSMPFRTRFGYHIVKVIDRRKARGEVKVAHIMIKAATEKQMEAMKKSKMDSIYIRLQNGATFEEMAKTYSEDEGTASKGGALNNITSTDTRWPEEFKDVAFKLNAAGDYSAPFLSKYGWHIIKLIERKELPSFDSQKEQLKTRISRDQRSEVNRNAVIERIKKEYNFTEYKSMLGECYKMVDSSLLKSHWLPDATKNYPAVMFTLGTQNFTQNDFKNYMNDYQTPREKTSIEAAVNGMYKDFVNISCLAYEEKRLDVKYDDFKNLYQEYHDGILLFDLTDKKVWSKAVNDTVGLKNYYEQNKTKYMWKDRIEATVYDCADAKIAKKVKKMVKKKIAIDSIQKVINLNSSLNVSAKYGKYEKGENAWLDSIGWNKGFTMVNESNGHVKLISTTEILEAQPKKLSEARGIITADYQSVLEKEWIAELRGKYPVVVNETTRGTLFK
jgi:peptidyl-prolyl cis-trans isomerase SurA